MEDYPVLFVSECLKDHLPKVVVDSEGRRYDIPTQKCADCGFDMTVSLEGLNDELVVSHSCHCCDKKVEDTVKLTGQTFRRLKRKTEKSIAIHFQDKIYSSLVYFSWQKI